METERKDNKWNFTFCPSVEWWKQEEDDEALKNHFCRAADVKTNRIKW